MTTATTEQSFTTTEVLFRLRASIGRLNNAMAVGKFTPPKRNKSGHFVWFEHDVERLRVALNKDLRFKGGVRRG
jgi:hypothetical protein